MKIYVEKNFPTWWELSRDFFAYLVFFLAKNGETSESELAVIYFMKHKFVKLSLCDNMNNFYHNSTTSVKTYTEREKFKKNFLCHYLKRPRALCCFILSAGKKFHKKLFRIFIFYLESFRNTEYTSFETYSFFP